jgi:hypothetical protein
LVVQKRWLEEQERRQREEGVETFVAFVCVSRDKEMQAMLAR